MEDFVTLDELAEEEEDVEEEEEQQQPGEQTEGKTLLPPAGHCD